MEILLKPTIDQGDQPAVMQEAEPDERTGEDIASEPEPLTVTRCVSRQWRMSLRKYLWNSSVWRIAPPTLLTLCVSLIWSLEDIFDDLKDLFEENLIDWFGELIPNTPESPVPPESPAFPESPTFPIYPAYLGSLICLLNTPPWTS